MANTNDGHSEATHGPSQASADTKAPAATRPPLAPPPSQPAVAATPAGSSPPAIHAAPPKSHHLRNWLLAAAAVVGVAVAGILLVPWVQTVLNTVSTDDAYVNGHVTFVAARVPGQVTTPVLVDDNYRVKKGDLLVVLDKEPYQIQVDIKKAALLAAKADLVAAEATAQGLAAKVRAARFKLDHSMEEVNNQIANLAANVATYKSKQATRELATANLKRGEELAASGGMSKEELDQRRQAVKVAEAAVDQALEIIHANRVSLGLPAEPGKGHALTEVPANLDQNFSSVRQALGELMQNAAQLGYFSSSFDLTPNQVKEEFFKQDPKGNLDQIFARLIRDAPAVKQAEAKHLEAERDLKQAELNLRYCDVFAEIDGVVTRRNVNPGNNVQAGQNLMAIRSLKEIWIDANFKETQLAELQIGQRVKIEVDMYGSQREFEGRITGFTMGTGSTLSLLPPENATGNFVKIVQRLPVRIELTNYDPDKGPLFIGLSATPYVYIHEPPTGPNAGKVLQPYFEGAK
jgi:membrane fusion protein, multidrug efflux system